MSWPGAHPLTSEHPAGTARVGALALALVAAAVLLVTGGARQQPPDDGLVAQAWPAATRAQLPGLLADGAAYQPLFVIDPARSIGTARSPDRQRTRLVHLVVGPDGAEAARTDLRDLAAEGNPQFGGLTTDGTEVAWAESTIGADGRGQTRLWATRLDGLAEGRSPPREVTADTGDVAFLNSGYDMVIADGQLHWVATTTVAGDLVTEVRSVPLRGGVVTVRQVPGAWALSAWPWLVSALALADTVEIRDLRSGQVVTVPASRNELVTCSPQWCRVIVLPAAEGPAGIDLMRPDGSRRQRIAGPQATAALVDVAVADRFEVYTLPGAGSTALRGQELMFYDLRSERSYQVATGVGMVLHRNGFLAWSTGNNETLRWHALDLRSLN